jgi:hypothetical protein
MSIADIQIDGNPILEPNPVEISPQQQQLVEMAEKVQGIADFIRTKDEGALLTDGAKELLTALKGRNISVAKFDEADNEQTFYLDDDATVACRQTVDDDGAIHADHFLAGKRRLHVDYAAGGEILHRVVTRAEDDEIVEQYLCSDEGVLDELQDKDGNTIKKRAVDDNEPAFDVSEADEPEIDKAEKKKKEKEAEKAKIKSDQWKPVAIAAAAVGLAVIAVFVFSFAAAALIVGTTLLEMSIVVIIGGAAIAGAGLTIYFGLIRPAWSDKIKILEED